MFNIQKHYMTVAAFRDYGILPPLLSSQTNLGVNGYISTHFKDLVDVYISLLQQQHVHDIFAQDAMYAL